MFDFFERLQSADPRWVGREADDAAAAYGLYSRESIIRQYSGDPANESRGPLRLSSLGKPAIQLAAALPGPKAELAEWGLHNHPPDETMRLVFAMGDWFENWVGFQLRRLGYVIEECNPCSADGQHMAEFNGVPGHLDFIVYDPQNNFRFVLEVKTMSTYYFNQFFDVKYNEDSMFLMREGVGDDERGYLTQLSTYMHHTGLPGFWLALDKGSRKMAIASPDPQDVDAALARATRVITQVLQVQTLEDVFTLLSPPPGEPEVFKKQLTGRLKMPTSMAYWDLAKVFYGTENLKNGYNKATEYVGSFDVDEYIRLLDESPERVGKWLQKHTAKRSYQEARELFN